MGRPKASQTIACVGLDRSRTDCPSSLPIRGYVRVSTLDLNLAIQRAVLEA